jgi:signal transduction histidine kinase
MIASLLYDHTGTIAGSIESIRILTDRKREEEAFKIANKKITMLNSITRHDILNQLLVLRAYIELSKQKNQDPVIAEFISKEEKAAESIQMQIEFTRTYQDIGSQAPRWQNLEEIVASAIGKLKPVITDMNFALGNAEIFADPLLEKVFYNLMENSLRHGDHVTRMDFSTQERENGLVILYSDNGGGISADDKKMLFKKGFGKHTGLGLFLSREILSITGITIKETGEPGKGARFEMTVPAGMWRRYGTGTGED